MASIHELAASTEADPDDWDARLNLAQAYKELGMTDEALTALRGNPLAPMTMGQSRLVKELRSELDPDGKVDMSGPVHPVSGTIMQDPVQGEEHVDEEVLQVVEVVEEGSYSEPVAGHQGERSIVLAGEVDPNAIKPHDKESDATQKVSALTVAILAHVGVALILGFVVMALPPPNPPQIVATAYTPEADEEIEQVKMQQITKATAASASSKPTFAISSMASSPIAIPEFDESQNVDVTLGVSAHEVGTGMSFDKGKEATSDVNFFGIRSSGSRMVFIIEASRYMLTDRKGGIPAYNKVKDEIAQMLAGLNRQTAFNLIIYDGKKIATFQDELVAATPSNIRQAIEWFAPINKDFEKIGLRDGYSSQPIQSGIDPIPVDDLVHYIKASQRALEMDVNTIFLLSNGWGWHRKTMEQREYEKWMRKQKWGEKEEAEWALNVKKARDWLNKENAARLKKNIPRRVVTSLNEIVSEILPGVRHKPGPSYSMEEVEDQMKNAVSAYYRAKKKPRPKFNVVWFVGEDENPSASIEAHLEQQTKRNRGKLKVLKGMAGLTNVTGG